VNLPSPTWSVGSSSVFGDEDEGAAQSPAADNIRGNSPVIQTFSGQLQLGFGGGDVASPIAVPVQSSATPTTTTAATAGPTGIASSSVGSPVDDWSAVPRSAPPTYSNTPIAVRHSSFSSV
jgi:hypothetical protein